jgi:DNA-binding NarL/FixJ family response regulator
MVLLDLGLADSGGLQTLDRFREGAPEVPVVVLSGEQEARHIRAAIDHGAVGFVPKSHTSELMIAALRFVLSGGIYLPPNVLAAGDPTSDAVGAALARLSPRQKEVCRLLLQGCSNKLIARHLELSEGTVKAHVSAVFQIIGARNRVDAVILAARCGMQVM